MHVDGEELIEGNEFWYFVSVHYTFRLDVTYLPTLWAFISEMCFSFRYISGEKIIFFVALHNY